MEPGETFTRKQIVDSFGGLGPGAFPAKDGRVVCALLDLSTDAVTHLTGEVIAYPKTLSKAAKDLEPGDQLPVFLKISSQLWRFAGEYELKRMAKSGKDLERAAKEVGRDNVAAVMTFEPASPKLKVVKGKK